MARPRPMYRQQRSGRYPSLENIQQGGRPAPQMDALQRYTTRANEAPTPPQAGGRGLMPYLSEAGGGQAISPGMLQAVDRLGPTPQARAKHFRTSDPRLQAQALMRRRPM